MRNYYTVLFLLIALQLSAQEISRNTITTAG